MMHHIVMWKLADTLTSIEKEQVMLEFQRNMHTLGPIVEGIHNIEVIINKETSSNMDMMLVSTFNTSEVLKQYQEHPKHKAATRCLNHMVSIRSCVDYED